MTNMKKECDSQSSIKFFFMIKTKVDTEKQRHPSYKIYEGGN